MHVLGKAISSGGRDLNFLRESSIKSITLKSFDLNLRQTCDLDLLLDGSFNPLNGFLTKKEYMSVCENMLLLNGELWPIPINLDVSKEFADTLELGEEISLKDQEGVNLAILTVEDIWYPEKLFEAEKVFGTTNSEHPGVNYLLNKSKATIFCFVSIARTIKFHQKYLQADKIAIVQFVAIENAQRMQKRMPKYIKERNIQQNIKAPITKFNIRVESLKMIAAFIKLYH